MRLHFIYKVTHGTTGRFYIGRTDNPKKRWSQHSSGVGNKVIQGIVNKHGKKSLVFQIIDSCTFPEIIEKEQIYLDKFFHHPLNINLSNSSKGCSKDSKHSLAMQEGLKVWRLNNPNYGDICRKNSIKSRSKVKEWYSNKENKESFILKTTNAQRKRFEGKTKEEKVAMCYNHSELMKDKYGVKTTVLTWSGVILDNFKSKKECKKKYGNLSNNINRKVVNLKGSKEQIWLHSE